MLQQESRLKVATGPNTLVPFISPDASNNTQALSSNLIYEPSFQRTLYVF